MQEKTMCVKDSYLDQWICQPFGHIQRLLHKVESSYLESLVAGKTLCVLESLSKCIRVVF